MLLKTVVGFFVVLEVITGWSRTAGIFMVLVLLCMLRRLLLDDSCIRLSGWCLGAAMMLAVATMLSNTSSCWCAEGKDSVDKENDANEDQDEG